MTQDQSVSCSVCGKRLTINDVVPGRFVRASMAALIAGDFPSWDADSYICHSDLNRYRSLYVEDVLTREKGELSSLEQEVVASLREHDILTENLNETVAQEATFGERLADHVASFGGSWAFILLFASVLVVWIVIN